MPRVRRARLVIAAGTAVALLLGGYSAVSAAGAPAPTALAAVTPRLEGDEAGAARLEARCAAWLAEHAEATGKRAEFCARVIAGEAPRPAVAERTRLERLQAQCRAWVAAHPAASGPRAEFCASVLAGVIPERPQPEGRVGPQARQLAVLQGLCRAYLAEHPGEAGPRTALCQRILGANGTAARTGPGSGNSGRTAGVQWKG